MTPTEKALLDELQAAHLIIRHALNIMTPEQKLHWGDIVARSAGDSQPAGPRKHAAGPDTGDTPMTPTEKALLDELQAAHLIIRHALNIMTPKQKLHWGDMNEAAGVAGEGITRANERESILIYANQQETTS